MRGLLRLLVGLFLTATLPAAHAAFSVVQCTSTNAAGNQTAALTSVAANNLLLLFAAANGNSNTISGVSDSQGAYTLATTVAATGVHGGGWAYYLKNTNSGTHTATVSASNGGTWGAVVLCEISGASTVSPVDVANSLNIASGWTTATDNLAGTALTTTQANGYLVCFTAPDSTNDTNSAGTGFSLGVNFVGSISNHVYTEYKALTTTGSKQCTWTANQTSDDRTLLTVALAPPAPAATLSSGGSNTVRDVSANATVTSDTTQGTLYVVAASAGTTPTATQIKACQNSAGTTSPCANVSAASGSNTLGLTGLSVSTAYTAHFVQNNGSDSNVVSTTFTTTAAAPSISSVNTATPAYLGSLTITGTTFGTSTGSVSLGGCAQTPTAWGTTSITVTVARCTNAYGTALALTVTSGDTSLTSTSYSGVTGMTAQSGWTYVTIGMPNATSSKRVTAAGDIAASDQLAYDTKSGLVTVATDGTFYADPTVISFSAEVWTPSSWGSTGLQTLISQRRKKKAGAIVLGAANDDAFQVLAFVGGR